MAESKVVAMNISCLGEECEGCPELEIEVDRYMAHGIGIMGGTVYVNHLRCEHVDRCVQIARTVEKKVRKSDLEPNYPEGTKVKLTHYDPKTGKFTEGPEQVVCRKNRNPDNEKDGV